MGGALLQLVQKSAIAEYISSPKVASEIIPLQLVGGEV
jgi:hypothetical protein